MKNYPDPTLPPIRAEEAVLEVLAKFGPDRPACRSEDNCSRYRLPDGRRCAIGHLLTDPLPEMEGLSVEDLVRRHGRTIFRPERNLLPEVLLTDLQEWHDLALGCERRDAEGRKALVQLARKIDQKDDLGKLDAWKEKHWPGPGKDGHEG